MTKNCFGSLDWSNEREKCFEKVWNSVKHVKTKVFKKLSSWFSIDRKKDSIDQKIGLIVRNSGKKKKFWKTKQFYVETPQSIEF